MLVSGDSYFSFDMVKSEDMWMPLILEIGKGDPETASSLPRLSQAMSGGLARTTHWLTLPRTSQKSPVGSQDHWSHCFEGPFLSPVLSSKMRSEKYIVVLDT